jgi:hypothetical protein
MDRIALINNGHLWQICSVPPVPETTNVITDVVSPRLLGTRLYVYECKHVWRNDHDHDDDVKFTYLSKGFDTKLTYNIVSNTKQHHQVVIIE